MKSKGNWRAGFETVPNFRIYYRDWRPQGGEAFPPVLALHGSLTQSGMWLATAEGVARARFICPDQRGYGRTEDPGQGDAAEDFARDAIGLANVLMLNRFIVMGHSFAGAIALKAAAMEPERVVAAVLMDPTVRDAAGNRQNLDVTLKRPEGFASLAEAGWFLRKSEEGEWPAMHLSRFIRDVMVCGENGGPCRMPYERERLIRLRAFQASEAGDYDPLRAAREVRCPVLVFRGGRSRRFSAEGERRLMKTLPRGSKAILCPKAGHFPVVSQPALVQRGLREFFAKVG